MNKFDNFEQRPLVLLPDETLPPECKPIAFTEVRICGKYKRVVITPVNDPWFAYNGGVASDIGRALP